MRSTWGSFATFCDEHGETPEEQELIAAKLMGRWRSGAPLVLSPDKDDPALGADQQRNNDFNYKEMDPHGYAVPLGSHARRMNPRDTAANMNRRRMIRRGATYGRICRTARPRMAVERGIAAFVICASLIRQFEFAQNVWANDRNFHELGNERDPIIGNQDGTLEFKIPKRPIRKKITGLPAFTTVRGGAYFFLPGLKALGYLASLDDRAGAEFVRSATEGGDLWQRQLPPGPTTRTTFRANTRRASGASASTGHGAILGKRSATWRRWTTASRP